VNITKLRFSITGLFESLKPYLSDRVFHVTKESNSNPILECGEIRPNQNGSYPTTFGSKNSFFRNCNCVSLFDYRPDTAEHFEEYYNRCLSTFPASSKSGIAIFIISESVYPILKPWTLSKEEMAHRGNILPYLEVGHPGPIRLARIIHELFKMYDNPLTFLIILVAKSFFRPPSP
jgi:hypothetical protein